MRNITEIHFSDTTGNGKFSGKPDLPVEIFFLGASSVSPAAFCHIPARSGLGWGPCSSGGAEEEMNVAYSLNKPHSIPTLFSPLVY